MLTTLISLLFWATTLFMLGLLLGQVMRRSAQRASWIANTSLAWTILFLARLLTY